MTTSGNCGSLRLRPKPQPGKLLRDKPGWLRDKPGSRRQPGRLLRDKPGSRRQPGRLLRDKPESKPRPDKRPRDRLRLWLRSCAHSALIPTDRNHRIPQMCYTLPKRHQASRLLVERRWSGWKGKHKEREAMEELQNLQSRVDAMLQVPHPQPAAHT